VAVERFAGNVVDRVHEVADTHVFDDLHEFFVERDAVGFLVAFDVSEGISGCPGGVSNLVSADGEVVVASAAVALACKGNEQFLRVGLAVTAGLVTEVVGYPALSSLAG
jgi:hypothetical protein